MRRPCNKCGGRGSYRTDPVTLATMPCSRCVGRGLPRGVMDRTTKAEKRRRRLVRRDGDPIPR